MAQPWTHSAPGATAYERINEHYVEPEWVSARLFDVEKFSGTISDPCCGFGRIVYSAGAAGYEVYGSDIANRGNGLFKQCDFMQATLERDNLVFNPPFDIAPRFIMHALSVTRYKIAAIFPTARLNAAHWLKSTPLLRIWLLTPRPSMPPGHVIAAGGKVSGGKTDYCWLVFDKTYVGGRPVVKWLHRDKSS